MAEVKVIGNIYNNILKGLQEGKTLIALQGSARSGKTRNSIIFLIQCALAQKVHISVVRASLPVLKRSVFRDDFVEVLLQMGIWDERSMNKTEMTYKFSNGSIVEFFATDGPEGAQKSRGPGRDILFCNEANEIEEENFKQMRMRTRKFVLLDFNPSFTEEHWLFKILSDKRTYHFISTFANNPFLPDVIREEILSYKYTNPALWEIFGEGKFAIVEGLVFPKGTWDTFQIEDMPIFAKEHRMGIDFGYTCFSGDTLIHTYRGQVPIRDVKDGDFVLTRKGFRRVNKKLYKGRKIVEERELLINGCATTIKATPEHKFKTFGKWKKYEELTEKDNLCVLSSSMERSIKDILPGNIQTTIITSGRKMEDTILKCCITQSGSQLMEPSLMVRLSIIKTLILSTMTYRTCSLLRKESTRKFTTILKSIKQKNRQEKCVSRVATGETGEKSLLRILKTRLENAIYAAKNILRLMFIRDFADIPAATEWCTLENVKLKRVYKTDVYDLSIDGCHEYFANGILVHNCDPTAVVETWSARVDGVRHLWINELVYEKGLKTKQIAARIKQYNDLPKYSESADPRLIDELEDEGISMLYPVKKFAGSLVVGIQKLQGYKIHITSQSTNIIKEFRNYCWQKDRHGAYMNVPIDKFNHAIDAIRYSITDERSNTKGSFFDKNELGFDF